MMLHNRKIKIVTLSAMIFFATNLRVEGFNKAGRTSLQFLKIGIGARSSAMGEACIANLNSIDAVFWNPAAITQMQRLESSFSYTKWIGDLNVTAGAVGLTVDRLGSIALDYIAMDYGDIPEALVTSPDGKLDTRTGLNFSGGDLSVGLSFSKMFTDRLSIGIRTKYLREDLYTYSTSLWAFDVGTYYNTGWKGIRLAMTAQNFASQARWLKTQQREEQQYEVPLVFRIGTSIDLLGGKDLFLGGNPNKQRLSLNIDAIHSNDYAERLNIGAEYWLWNRIALRTGYRTNREEGHFSVGAALNIPMDFTNLVVDYSFVDYDYLNSAHQFTVMLRF